MQRCLQLAGLAIGNTAPNPLVGAVLVHEGNIIGEGYHQQYGQSHAEVNCINSVSSVNIHLIPESTLYVNLEPCAHFGKTPPCADLIISNDIREVVVGCEDPFTEVNGKGIAKLEAAGVHIIKNILHDESRNINRRFFTFHERKRPYIILKWAQTADGFIATGNTEPLKISNAFTDRLVHKWRSEEASIMVGTNTALLDDPALTARLWTGNDPLRIVLDLNLRLPGSLQLFQDKGKTVIINRSKDQINGALKFMKIADGDLIAEVLEALHQANVQSILIEGGAKLIQSFVHAGLWDAARVITNTSLNIGNGIPAPKLLCADLLEQEQLHSDLISYYSNNAG